MILSYFDSHDKSWDLIKEELVLALEKQNYKELLNNLYQNSFQEETYDWACQLEHSNHVPIFYYLVRHQYLSGFKNEDEIEKALTRSFKAIFLSLIHISECQEVNKKFEIIEILTKKFQEKLSNLVTEKIFVRSCENIMDYFLSLMKSEQINLSKANRSRIIPRSEWIYKVGWGGWYQPALDCQVILDKEKEIIENKFSHHAMHNYEKHSDACEQGMEKIEAISKYFKDKGVFDLVSGFKGEIPAKYYKDTESNEKELDATEKESDATKKESDATKKESDATEESDEKGSDESDSSYYYYDEEESENEDVKKEKDEKEEKEEKANSMDGWEIELSVGELSSDDSESDEYTYEYSYDESSEKENEEKSNEEGSSEEESSEEELKNLEICVV